VPSIREKKIWPMPKPDGHPDQRKPANAKLGCDKKKK